MIATRRIQRIAFSPKFFVSNYSRYGFNQQIEDIEAAEEARRRSYDGVQTLTSAAVRALELCEPDTGNFINLKVLDNLSSKLKSLETNWTANAVFVGSRSNDFFSLGIHDDDAEAEGEEIFSKVQSIAAHASDYADQKLLALYGGYITGTPFGMLMGAHYRLGTPSLNLAVLEPTRGQIPLGGLCHRFCLASAHGKVVARYLACSGAELHAVELYEMGILTNLTDHRPHTGWQYGDTMLINDTQAVQPPQGEPEFLPDMVESVDINCDFDVSKHDAWNKFLLVTPEWPDEEEKAPDHINFIYSSVEKAFDVDTVEETVAILKELAPSEFWAHNTLQHMSTCDPLAMQAVFDLTADAMAVKEEVSRMQEVNESTVKVDNYLRSEYLSALQKELAIAKFLLAQQRDRKGNADSGVGWYNQHVIPKSEFDLSVYEDEPEEEVDLLEPKTNKQLLEEALQKEEEIRQKEEKFSKSLQKLDSILTLQKSRMEKMIGAIRP